MKKRIIMGILLLLVTAFSGANAVTFRVEATPELGPGYIQRGVPFTIDFYMNNDAPLAILGYSMPVAFYSPDQSIVNVTHVDVGGYGDFGSILMLNGYDGFWSILNQWTGFSWDGSLADTINHTAASLSGWPNDLGEQLFLQFHFQIDEQGTFCVDSVSVPNQSPPGKFDWLFDYYSPFGGPYCWDVVDEIPQNPEIGVDPASFTFNTVYGNPPPSPQVLHITNEAAGTLDWTATWSSAWLNVAPSFGTAPSNVQVTVNPTGLAVGTYYDTITVSDPDAINDPVLVPVTFNITEPPPVICLSPTFFSFTAVADGANPPDQVLIVDNCGGGVLEWTASNSTAWLSIAPGSGTDYGEITLSVDITGLSFGEYFDTVVVSDPEASNDPQLAVVRLEVASSLPVMELDPGFLFVAVDIDSPVPDDRQFDILNTGAGTMNFTLETNSTRILSLTPDSGAAPQAVTIQFDTIPGMAGQRFYDTVVVNSLEAINSPQLLIIQYYLSEDPARIIASRDSVYIELYECGQGIGLFFFPIVTIYNGGGEPFSFKITNSQPWLQPTPDTADAPQQVQLILDYQQMAPGMYFDTMVVSAQNAINDPVLVQVVLNILPTDQDPEIWVDRQNITLAAQEEYPGRPKFLLVNNANPGCMSWELQEDITWITHTVDSAEAGIYPWNVQLHPNGFGMIMGHYFDTAYVAAPDASNNPLPLYLDIWVWKLRGDVNYDGKIDMLDLVYFIAYLYTGGPPPFPERIVGDVNCDYAVNLNDIVAMIDYLYYGAGPLCGNPY